MANAEQPKKDPNALFKDAAKPRLAKGLGISFIIHIVLLGVLSISFIGLCFQYKTTRPKAEIKRIEMEKKAADEEKARQDRIKLAQQKAMEKAATVPDKPKDKTEDETKAENLKAAQEKYDNEKEDPSKAVNDIPAEIGFPSF